MSSGERILILAPHQDDELILCGCFLNGLVEQGYQIYIVYMTNGDYEVEIGKVRLSEALKAMREFGLPEDHIIFMGYANEYDVKGPHIYNAKNGQIVKSQFGNWKTYGLKTHPEYRYKKCGHHHVYKRENLVRDLFDIIQEIKPAIIFSTDAEIHPDHKANSLFLDEVLGNIFKIDNQYNPILLKKPEYATSWFNPADYSRYNNKESVLSSRVKVNGEVSDFYNPYMRWRYRTRLPIDLSAQIPRKRENSLWNALNIYQSQNAQMHYEQVLNSDVVFWARRTDSLTYDAHIETSSGDGFFLNDFKIFDSEDIRRTSQDAWETKASVWHPRKTDANPYIKISWKEKKRISSVVIYQEFCPEAEVINSHILLGNGQIIAVGKLHKRKPTVVFLNATLISNLTFVIDECSRLDKSPGISEIEVYEEKPIGYSYMKLLINDNFVYRYIMPEDDAGRISVYLIDKLGFSHYIGLDKIEIVVSDLYGKRLRTDDYVDSYGKICRKVDQDIRLQGVLCCQPELRDSVLIFRDRKKEKRYWDLVCLLRKVEIPMNDILEMENSVGFDKLNYIREFYRVASLRKQYKLCILLRFFYLYYQGRCNQRGLLSNAQIADGNAFLYLGECMPGSGKYIKEYYHCKTGNALQLVQKNKRRVFFIGTPSHYNIGDHVIALATKNYLKKILPNAAIIEVSIHEFPYALRVIEKAVNKNDLFVLQGGGNMGNIYWTNERIRREILRCFPNNHIIIFPETLYYEDTVYGKAEMEESRRIYGRAKYLTICAREKASYQMMKKLYTCACVILTPDIACSYRFQVPKLHEDVVRLFFRSDKESCINMKMQNRIKKILDRMGYQYVCSDMLYQSKGYIGRANREYIVAGKVREISGAKFVITDRLHVMILSVLTGTPCIAFYGYNHKIESTYKTWFSEIPYLVLERDEEHLPCSINEVLNAANKSASNWYESFEPLNKVIKEAWIWEK